VSTILEPQAIRVVVGDERRLIAEAIAALIATMSGFSVTGVIGPELVTKTLAEQEPDLLLLGIPAGSYAARESVRSMREWVTRVQVVLLADTLKPALVQFVLDQRLSGLLLTDLPARDVAECLDQVARGRAVLPAGWQRVLADGRNDPIGDLSERQLEVLELLAEGCRYAEIASRLFISVNTVKFHARSIFSQLGVANRMAAANLLNQHSFGWSTRDAPTALPGPPGRPRPSVRVGGDLPGRVGSDYTTA
jgi:DNA-binding NarL/FixJ family response regulator